MPCSKSMYERLYKCCVASFYNRPIELRSGVRLRMLVWSSVSQRQTDSARWWSDVYQVLVSPALSQLALICFFLLFIIWFLFAFWRVLFSSFVKMSERCLSFNDTTQFVVFVCRQILASCHLSACCFWCHYYCWRTVCSNTDFYILMNYLEGCINNSLGTVYLKPLMYACPDFTKRC